MNLWRLGSAVLLTAVTASPVAVADSSGGRIARHDARGPRAPDKSGERRLKNLFERLTEASARARPVVQAGPGGQGAVFSQPGDWTHAEAAVVIGSQLVDQDLGFSQNIFQTVTAEAEDVGFGQHYGARGAFFANRYLGAEAGFARTVTEFEFSVTDEDAGVTIFAEPLEQISQEVSVSAVLQWPRAAVTPYGVVGYAWRTSEVEGAEPFESGAVVVGFGIKVPFPRLPVSLAFDYRYIEYQDEEGDALRLAEGGVGSPTVSALTLGVVVRLNVNR